MPTVADPNNNSQKILALLFQAEKARLGGGGGHGHGVSRPGSRGGHPWTDSRGNIQYGKQPQQILRTHGPSANLRAAVARHKPGQQARPTASHGPALHPNSPAATRLRQTRMLEELMKVHRTGLDPHGNKLNPKQLAQVNSLITALRIQTHPLNKGGVGRTKEIAVEVTQEITAQAQARLPFTVFKDAKGQYRWVGVSSSAAQDADGETVSLKALQEDVARKDITREFGSLNWWHTPIKIGMCDFNAMDGPLLVESGTFVNDQVAEHLGKAIKNGVLQPGLSLEFEHNEPGPQVLPGRVFKTINKKDRALLPSVKASNLLTSFKVYSLKSAALADKEVKQMIPKEKLEELERILPPELLSGLLEGNQTAIKMAIAANHSFKEMTAVAEPVAVVAPAPEPAPVKFEEPTAEDLGKLSGTIGAELENRMDQIQQEFSAKPVEVEEEGEAIDAAALFESLTQSITDRVLAGLATTQATATKEVSDLLALQTVALKDNTAALNKVVAENEALKARLGALEGTQPAAVKARASQQGGVTADQLPDSVKELVNPATKETDPYAKIIADLGLSMAPRG
jgi:hypothetical protein